MMLSVPRTLKGLRTTALNHQIRFLFILYITKQKLNIVRLELQVVVEFDGMCKVTSDLLSPSSSPPRIRSTSLAEILEDVLGVDY